MRAISNTVMAALVVLALLWGNCFSCPLALKSEKTTHGCCHRTKQTTDKCPTQVLKQFMKADPAATPAPAPAVMAIVRPLVEVDFPLAPERVTHPAPDLLSLISSLRV